MSDAAALVETKHEYQHVFGIYVPIALGVLAVITIATVAAVLLFRRRSPSQAARWHENTPVEAAYAALLVGVVAFLLYVTFSAEQKVDAVARRQQPALTVNVFGSRWEWHFQYAAYGIDRYSGEVGDERLVVPAGEPVAYRLVTLDVIHEFWVPELKYKHDLIPGMAQVEILTFSRPGVFAGHCGEFCGVYHSRMNFTVEALPPARFSAWLTSHRRAAGPAGGAGQGRPSGHEGAAS